MITRRSFIKASTTTSGLFLMGQWPKDATQMITKKIPSTGEEIPVIGLGTWQTFDVGNHRMQRENLSNVLDSFVKNGGKVVDSSPMYGSSETVVGDLSMALGINDQLFIATKVWTNGKQAGINQMKDSYSKLKRKKMELMQVHNLLDWKTHLPVLMEWKEQAKLDYIGVTHYHSGGYNEMAKIMMSQPIDFIQINYSLTSKAAGNRILPLAKEKGIAVLINRPYEGGSLFRMVKNKPLPAWCEEIGCQSWGQFFLKFIISHLAVTCVIPGTSKVHHLEDNLRAGYGELPDENMRRKMVKYFDNL